MLHQKFTYLLFDNSDSDEHQKNILKQAIPEMQIKIRKLEKQLNRSTLNLLPQAGRIIQYPLLKSAQIDTYFLS